MENPGDLRVHSSGCLRGVRAQHRSGCGGRETRKGLGTGTRHSLGRSRAPGPFHSTWDGVTEPWVQGEGLGVPVIALGRWTGSGKG